MLAGKAMLAKHRRVDWTLYSLCFSSIWMHQHSGEICWIYATETSAFRAHSYPPLGLADHNVIYLLPLYKLELKRQKLHVYSTLLYT